jgi:hypothetical protein
MDNCDFKAAFYSLGGIYQKPTASSRLAVYQAQKAKEKRLKQEQELKKKKDINNTLIHTSRELFKKAEPLSDEWWDYLDMYYMAILKDENMEGGA